MKLYKKLQHGAVSIFIVIFAALLIAVVTIAFVGIMMKDQQQATAADLSLSAYDSAQAGVEDAKRALLQYQSICESGDDCSAAKAVIESEYCNESLSDLDGIVIEEGEVDIKTGTSESLSQAYTCVKIDIDTVDYLGVIDANEYELVSLVGVSDFNSVKLEWFSSKNLTSGEGYSVDVLPLIGSPYPLFNPENWPNNRPPILQTQLIQYGDSFSLGDFDSINALGESNANTMFLYPVNAVTAGSYSFTANDNRRTSGSQLTPVQCKPDLSSGGYACSITLTLPNPIGGGARTAYLYIGSLYNRTDFKVSLYNGLDLVNFGGVQPEVDSTGRANDLFRRVKVRVKMSDAAFPYPISTVYVSDGLCKNFIITDILSDYVENCT